MLGDPSRLRFAGGLAPTLADGWGLTLACGPSRRRPSVGVDGGGLALGGRPRPRPRIGWAEGGGLALGGPERRRLVPDVDGGGLGDRC